MKTSDRMFDKQEYTSPEIVSVELDIAISLALESEPPLGPGEELFGYNKNEPFTFRDYPEKV